MDTRHGFLKLSLFAGILAVPTLFFGLFISEVQALDLYEDPYDTGTAHITIFQGNDTAGPLLYPDRFVGLQVFKGSIPTDTSVEDTLSAISWGDSIDSDVIIRQLAISNWDIGELNTEAPEVTSGKINADDYEGITTLGNLFTRYCVNHVKEAITAYASAGGTNESGLEAASAVLNSGNVSAALVANFLQQFALGDASYTPYANPSIFTSSEVSAGFTYVVSQSNPNLDGLIEGESKWTSYGLKIPTAGEAETSALNLFNSSVKEARPLPETDGWVIDSVDNFGPGVYAGPYATSKGLPIGYYVVIDKLADLQRYSSSSSAVSELILRVVDNNGLVLDVKNDVPTVDKKIKGVITDDAHDASVIHTGDNITYILTGTLPNNVEAYRDLDNAGESKYTIIFKDTFPDIFNLKSDSLKLFVNVDGDENGCKDSSARGDANLNSYRDALGEEGNNAIEVDLKNNPDGEIRIKSVSNKTWNIEITVPNAFNLIPKDTAKYGSDSIKVNKDSIIYAVYDGWFATAPDSKSAWGFEFPAGSLEPYDYLKNTVWMDYSNNPYTEGYGSTSEDSVQHYFFALDLIKFENDFGGDNARLEGAGFSMVKSASGEVDTLPNLDSDDPDNLDGKENDIQVAWFRRYDHSYKQKDFGIEGPKGYDPFDAFDPDQYVYVFAGWHKPVLATNDYVEVYNSDSSNPSTDHMHIGMLVTALDDAGKPVYKGNGGSVRAATYYQVLVSDVDGRATVLGLGNDTYTIIESLTPANYKSLQPFTWKLVSDNPSETSATLKVYAQDAAGENFFEVASSEADASPVGDAKLFVTSRNNLPEHSPYYGNMLINLYLRNVNGVVLPMTGGVGITMLYIAGVVFVLGGVSYLIYRHRELNLA